MPSTTMMRNTCSIQRKSETQSTSTGGPTTTWATNATGVQCSVQQISSMEDREQGREMFSTIYHVFFPAGTSILNTDRILSISGPSGIVSGQVLEVISAPVDHAGRAAYVMVTAQEVVE